MGSWWSNFVQAPLATNVHSDSLNSPNLSSHIYEGSRWVLVRFPAPLVNTVSWTTLVQMGVVQPHRPKGCHLILYLAHFLCSPAALTPRGESEPEYKKQTHIYSLWFWLSSYVGKVVAVTRGDVCGLDDITTSLPYSITQPSPTHQHIITYHPQRLSPTTQPK